MNERERDPSGDSRRQFLKSAGASVIAGGATVLAASAQTPQAPAPPSTSTPAPTPTPVGAAPKGHKPVGLRASGTIHTGTTDLGPLGQMSGTWIGKGLNTISLPAFDSHPNPLPFRVKVNTTHEILEIARVGGPIPNRGSNGQRDISLFGLHYLQRVSDAITNEALHIEPGLWLNVPATVAPAQPATVVRMGSIPHGTNILAQGFGFENPVPIINDVSTTPLKKKPTTGVFEPFPSTSGYLAPFQSATLPPGVTSQFLQNPNLALKNDISTQKIINTTILIISTAASQDGAGATIQAGSIGNIPFLDSNAKVTRLDAIFWIETVKPPDANEFLQLQYTQTIILEFLDIQWPHISVATLVKQ